jgi:predicted TIM-barrel fold metal-dependent hydrolase
MIIDAHTHRYPEEVIKDPAGFAQRTGEKMWLDMVSPKDRPSLQGWANRQEMLASMDAAGVRQSVLLGWYWENQKTCLEANQWHQQWIKQDKERFIGFLSLHPEIPNLLDYLKGAREDGFQGIGESHPWAQGFSMQNREWIKAMEFACESGWPVNFHVTDPEGKDYPGKTLTPMEDFLWLASELPDLKIILAHAGALYPLKNSIPLNFYIDLAACPLLYPASIFKELIEHVGSEKILWGTDYPLRIYPTTQKNPDFKTFLDTFTDSIEVTGYELRAMLGENFKKLLG